MFACFAVHPDSKHKNFASFWIDNNAGVAATVLGLGEAAVFTHIHDHPWLFPGAPAIGAAAETNVDILLQVTARTAAQVVDAQKRPWGTGCQGGDAVSVHTVFPCPAQGNTQPHGLIFFHFGHQAATGGHHLDAERRQAVVDVGRIFQAASQPECPVSFQHQVAGQAQGAGGRLGRTHGYGLAEPVGGGAGE